MTKPSKDEVLRNPVSGKTKGTPFSSATPSGVVSEKDSPKAKGSKSPFAEADLQKETNEGAEALEAEIIEEPSGLSAEEETALRAEVEELKDKNIRLHAEWDTYRRRTTEQRKEECTLAAAKVVTDLLPLVDDFERSIEYAEKNGEGNLLEGVKAICAKLMCVLEKEGVSVIDPAGEAFDAMEAQAVGMVENADMPDETVAEVFQKGYRMGKKVLRPAMVTVATGGSKRVVSQDSEEE